MSAVAGKESNDPSFRSEPFAHWSFSSQNIQVRFLGRQRPQARQTALGDLVDVPTSISQLQQRHSATAVEAAPGRCGEGDGLWTRQPRLALSIVTADCVPVVCASQGALAAVHAGWRGLAKGVIESTLSALSAPSSDLEAWLGPSIGPCCYEVSDDVAEAVARRSHSTVVRPATAGARPHLDLHQAAAVQLGELGVETVRRVSVCTQCHPNLLWSYRGTAGNNGRNLTVAWLDSPPGG